MSAMSMAEMLPPSLRVAKRALASWYGGEPELRLLPRLCRRDELVLDIGANYGIYSWHAARRAAGVVAFEPQPTIAQFLRQAFGTRVQVEEVALSDSAGEAVLRVPVDRMLDGCATIEAGNELTSLPTRTIVVPRRTLDSYAFGRAIGCIKLDVEGHELAVLEGGAALLSAERPSLIIEAEERHRDGAVGSLMAFLSGFGYRGYFLRGGTLHRIEDLGAGSGAGARAAAERIFNFIFLGRADLDPRVTAMLPSA